MKLRNIILAIALSATVTLAAPIGYAQTTASEITAESSTAQFTTYHGALELRVIGSETIHFHIYSITGQLIKRVAIADASVRIELPAGCYIVKCEKWAKKVVVN